jgi:hypothetical protein
LYAFFDDYFVSTEPSYRDAFWATTFQQQYNLFSK